MANLSAIAFAAVGAPLSDAYVFVAIWGVIAVCALSNLPSAIRLDTATDAQARYQADPSPENEAAFIAVAERLPKR